MSVYRYVIPRDLADLPHIISIGFVCALAGYSKQTLRRRIKAGLMPGPVSRGAGGDNFLREDVLRALGLTAPVPKAAEPAPDPWMSDPVKYAAAGAQMKKERGKPRR